MCDMSLCNNALFCLKALHLNTYPTGLKNESQVLSGDPYRPLT